MLPLIIEGRYVTGHTVTGDTVWLRFSDGAEGEVDHCNKLHGSIS